MPFNHPTSPLSPVPSISSPPIFSSPSPPPQPPPSVDGTRRRSPLSDAEKLDKGLSTSAERLPSQRLHTKTRTF
ncbi:hypothetical protein N7G274_010090 [Stereocaulon virgatum]|uniref:Uncharacterized protein n=1 Tax=Stereocaulon virgatum TaxID=373712 RepID=A0ABR3ZUG2_9LECA